MNIASFSQKCRLDISRAGLVKDSIAVIQHHDQKQLGKKKFISAYSSQVTLHHREKPG